MSTPETNLKAANVALAKAWGVHVPLAVVENMAKPGFGQMDEEFVALMLKTIKARFSVVVPTPTPVPVPTPVPPTPSGNVVTVTPGMSIQAAIDGLGAGGGTVLCVGAFTLSSPLKIPAALNGTLVLDGGGTASVKLAMTPPRFCVWNRDSGSLFRHVTVRGFTMDMGGLHPASGSFSPVGFDMQSGSSIYDAGGISIEDVLVANITATGIATSSTSAWNPCGVNVYTNADSGAQHVTGVSVQNVKLSGGSRGVSVWGAGSGITVDKVVITRCWHDTLVTPTSFSSSTNYQVGQDAHVGSLVMTDNYGARAFDCGIEVDNAESAILTGCIEENCYYNEFYYTNFATPLSGAGQTTLQGCTANVNINVHGGSGLGVGWEGTPIGRIDLNDFVANLAYGTKQKIVVAGGVVMAGLYVDGVKQS